MTNPYSPITLGSLAIGFMCVWMGFLLDLNTVGPNTGLIAPPDVIMGFGFLMMVGGFLYGALTNPENVVFVGGGGYSSADADLKRMADAVWFNTYILQPQQQTELLRKMEEQKR